MKNKIYLLALLFTGLFFNSCDTNTEDYKPVSLPDYSFVSTSSIVSVDSDAVTFDVIVSASHTYPTDRSVQIEIDDASNGNGLHYNFSGNLDILAGELSGSTKVKFNFNSMPSSTPFDLVLNLVGTSDQITISYTKVCTSNDIELSIEFDNFSNETSWEITDSTGAVVESSGGTYPSGTSNFDGSYTLPDGDYTFTIFDRFSDGICCDWGDGSYKLDKPACTEVLASGGAFGASEATTFSLP